MKKKIIVPSIIICLTLGGILTSAFLAKRIKQPTFISTAKELNSIRNDLNGYYVINNNISIDHLETEPGFDGWIPIGTKEKPFTGIIDFRNFALLNLTFSKSYIKSQFEDKKNDEVLLGFLGYSTGTLLNCRLYHPINPDISTYGDKRVVFGFGCAINCGSLKYNIIEYWNPSGTLISNNIVFGSLVGINNKEVYAAKTINTLRFNLKGESIVGSLIGISTKNSTNNYLSKGGYIDIYCSANGDFNLVIGFIIGKVEGGEISNCYVGANKNNQDEFHLYFHAGGYQNNKMIVGGIIGLVTGEEKVTISNCYVLIHFNIGFLSKFINASGGVGYSENKNLIIKNIVFDMDFNITLKSTVNSIMCNGLYDNVNTTNNLYTERVKSNLELITNNCIKKEIANITCEEMNFDTTSEIKWKKNDNRFYLILLEKK